MSLSLIRRGCLIALNWLVVCRSPACMPSSAAATAGLWIHWVLLWPQPPCRLSAPARTSLHTHHISGHLSCDASIFAHKTLFWYKYSLAYILLCIYCTDDYITHCNVYLYSATWGNVHLPEGLMHWDTDDVRWYNVYHDQLALNIIDSLHTHLYGSTCWPPPACILINAPQLYFVRPHILVYTYLPATYPSSR